MTRPAAFRFFAVALFLPALPAFATSLFSDFPANSGNAEDKMQISGGWVISDSFTLSAPGTATGVNFGAWVTTGDSMTQVDWAIGTTVGNNDVGGGTATVTGQYVNTASFSGSYDAFIESFSFSPPSLNAGTYYLTLLNAQTSLSYLSYWDVNNAAGITAYAVNFGDYNLSSPGACNSFTGSSNSATCANSFEILDNAPEPEWPVAFGVVLLVAASRRWRPTILGL